ncbi:hypothetical protein QBC47DRAFT_422947 [Echria macrotheca]|uniref:COP9 signalosome complex subunit 6 n=1 Tax=Echria macrotheca TaxID=438768 RepID=A0AAJ0FC54_9PEZI|nr:hypothetical protein QBC47DRAFT_422947 [Echria macrotheca]
MADQPVNELLSTHKSSDSNLQVSLHPLPLLEISDYITRGYQRGLKGAIVGGLLGQQNGREITIEHSFTCKSSKNADGAYELDQAWFNARLEQMKLVHKSPLLELVGWYSLVPKSGPTPAHLPIHRQILSQNESAVLLGFHADEILFPTAGDPLPLTIYESNMEAEAAGDNNNTNDEDKEMKDSEAVKTVTLKFRELPYTTETGEAEMIAMQFIREGGAHAGFEDAERRIIEQFDKKIAVHDGKGKQKRRAVVDNSSSSAAKTNTTETTTTTTPAKDKDTNLTKAEAEYMSALQAKFNAVKMLKSRVDLIVAYLQKLPPDFVAGKLTTTDQAAREKATDKNWSVPSNNILRQIQALVTNIELATPAHQTDLQREILQETNDVQLVQLVADLAGSINEVRDLGKKFAVVEAAKNQKTRQSGFDSALMAGGEYSRVSGDLL